MAPKKKPDAVSGTAIRSAHMKIPEVLHEALTVLAELEGKTFSDLMADLGRAELKKRGVNFEATGKQIEDALAQRRKKGHVAV